MNLRSACFIAAALVLSTGTSRADDVCEVCGITIEDTIYMWEDKVSNESRKVCSNCITLATSCFMCSLPVVRDFTQLPDGRTVCARDAKTIVLEETEALRLCNTTTDVMDRLFSRFTTFPEGNIEISLVDRVNLIALFRFPGRDYSCPNVMGYVETRTNRNQITHEICLMTGLPRSTLQSTFAHERTHAWMAENVSAQRRESINGDAEEGFCELVSYMVMDAMGSEDGKKAILLNGYTRGQIDLFLEAARQFGFNDVVDWMQYGVDARLREDAIGRIREVEMPVRVASAASSDVAIYSTQTVPPPQQFDSLTLKGLIGSHRKPRALINDGSFAPGEQGTVRLGTNRVLIRCVEIRQRSVLIQNRDTGEELELKLNEN